MACITKSFILSALLLVNTAQVGAQAVRPETVASGLQNPWAVAFLPEGRFLVTERPGRLRVIEPSGQLGAALKGLPPVAALGQGGLLDLVLDADFARNRTLYFCFAEPGLVGNSTALARARLSINRTQLEEVKVIFSQKPKVISSAHFGCRIVESQQGGKADGLLFLSLGERYVRKDDAQTLDNHHGKIIRIHKDGRVPADNPFVDRAGALPEIWSYGHRNVQGAALAPDGLLWTHEHGPQGGDEINLPQPGRNYGWPVITYGENYGGGKISDGATAKSGMEQPLHYWVPSIAPSGMAFLSSQRYGQAWVGNLFVGSLKFGYLDRIELSKPFKGQVVREHKLLAELGARIRDVRQGPDGLLYVLTDEARGRLIRLLPN
ncbi:MAG: PQQ-dependent sugar dehydrogenase [Gammaproteobacteria bacterium]|uniref:PQQ-dependent sugar dehydrogenase n=1 Tax=Rhodoferax sp. TaxID=50421 RepID=UPI00184C70C5|nr:PQQ-dependent sugar dehydrogenase [Rhodoferax sp.]MBU3899876.1 PQQ-dependent sugar dehydrogenase [Gammaproteobacteria bacterium]MBA3058632.1 PQQ-dependent sugar dehydrogenase [Rhodoferax sp.]MBU3996059.1 PQQ-dependent sugar dehydrogenase [Gammaproteobacteria bacterium]MBU4019141.1 PQQ-dependent sugar dehydrogenase [Gammaproteobacteria bacterium]MBU4078859.1 PQQ-dependent sugar dehydrogenase [Gammaproteobacteria bacterium]